MADWLKVLIGVFAGFIVGLISEPLKFWINGIVKQKAIRDALYPVMADIYGFALSRDGRTMRDKYPAAFPDSNFAVFDHYYSTEKSAFFGLNEAQFMITFFHLARGFFNAPAEDLDEQHSFHQSLLACLRTAIQSGAIDGKRIEKLVSRGPAWRKSA